MLHAQFDVSAGEYPPSTFPSLFWLLEMKTVIEEGYVLRHLACIDMARTLRSLDYLNELKDEYLREALFRDAVVSYVKPFSDNKGVHTKKGLKINEKGVPKELKAAHTEIVGIRNELFAHMDIKRQMPQLDVYEIDGEKHPNFTVTGYEKVYADHLIEPLKQLAKAVQSHLMEEMDTIARNDL